MNTMSILAMRMHISAILQKLLLSNLRIFELLQRNLAKESSAVAEDHQSNKEESFPSPMLQKLSPNHQHGTNDNTRQNLEKYRKR